MSATDQALHAAAFLIQALDLDQDPNDIVDDLATVHAENGVTTFATEFETSFGSAAFLVYVYDFASASSGGDVRARYTSDIDTLQTAAARDSPGPRLLANGDGEREGFILATTPATYRVMTSADSGQDLHGPSPLPRDLDVGATRHDSAIELLKPLRAANLAAGAWLAALHVDGSTVSSDANAETSDTVEFNEAETELALFLLDDRSIENVLRALNLFITAARRSTPV